MSKENKNWLKEERMNLSNRIWLKIIWFERYSPSFANLRMQELLFQVAQHLVGLLLKKLLH